MVEVSQPSAPPSYTVICQSFRVGRLSPGPQLQTSFMTAAKGPLQEPGKAGGGADFLRPPQQGAERGFQPWEAGAAGAPQSPSGARGAAM